MTTSETNAKAQRNMTAAIVAMKVLLQSGQEWSETYDLVVAKYHLNKSERIELDEAYVRFCDDCGPAMDVEGRLARASLRR